MYIVKNKFISTLVLSLLISSALIACDVTKDTESYGQRGATGKVDLLNPGDTLSSKGYGQTDTRGVQVKKAQSYDAPPPMFIDSDKAEKAFVKKFGKDNHKHYQYLVNNYLGNE